MAKASDNLFPSILLAEGSAPAAPTAGSQRLFVDSADDALKRIDSAGTVSAIGGGGGPSSQPTASVYRSAALSIPTNSNTVIPFDAEDIDTDAFHDLAANPSRLTVPSGLGGVYLLSAHLALSGTGGAADSERSAIVRVNGTDYMHGVVAGIGSTATPVGISVPATPLRLSAGDYVELWCYQNTGSAKSVTVSANRRYARLSLTRIAD